MVSLDDVRGTRIPENEWRGEAVVCEWLRMIGARRGVWRGAVGIS